MPKLRAYLNHAMRANRMDDPFYRERQSAHPFLQCDSQDYILIEFWVGEEDKTDIEAYVQFLEREYHRTIDRLERSGVLYAEF